MKHIFFVDPIEKLNIKKDSSLMVALSLQEKGEEVFLLFESDFFVSNTQNHISLHQFEGSFKQDDFYIEHFVLQAAKEYEWSNQLLHMRIDPPYDSRYQRYLWMLDYLENTTDVCVLNAPLGIMKYNEKLSAFALKHHIKSYVGSNLDAAKEFAARLEEQELILKPLDLYSGIGVEKISKDMLETRFPLKSKEFGGAIIVQPYLKQVEQGEYRSIYFDGELLGSILKTPSKGEFLTNIAQGASFKKIELPDNLRRECEAVAQLMLKDGVRFIAFDLLGDSITEINVTCPGLLVEVSHAYSKNFAHLIADKLQSACK